jgi:hypothetical protein
MDIEAKKKAILEACKTFSKTQLDPRGKGRYILSLERGEQTTEEKVNKIYETVLRLQNEAKGKGKVLDNVLDKKGSAVRQRVRQKEAVLLDNVLDKIRERLQQLEKTAQELDTAINLILVKQKGLEDRLASLEACSVVQEVKQKTEEQGKKSQATKMLGFALVQKSTSSKGRRYQKWYAVKRIEGKQVWVYVGEDVSKAEEKIREWLKQNNTLKIYTIK